MIKVGQNMLTGKDFENMGKAAAGEYINAGKPLNDTITKIAEHYGLNQTQVARVVEQANVETYIKLNGASDNKYIEFQPASSKEVADKLSYNLKKEASIAEDFDKISLDVEYSINSPALPEDTERLNKAEDSIEKKAFKALTASIEKRLLEVDESFSRESDNLYKLVKQASLEAGNFGIVKQAMIKAVPDKTTNVFINVYEDKLKKEACRLDFNDVEAPKGVLNKNHPLVKSLVKLSLLKEEYVNLNSLLKEAAGASNASKLLKSLVTSGGYSLAVAKDIISGATKGVMKHKHLGTAAITGTAALAIGRAKGRSEVSKANIGQNDEYILRGKANKPL
jgi:hypothetical protein